MHRCTGNESGRVLVGSYKMLSILDRSIQSFRRSNRSKSNSQKHFNCSYLKEDSIRSKFDSKVADLLIQRWEDCESVHAKWEALVKSTTKWAEQVLLISKSNSPDWFLENEHIIRPELEKKSVTQTVAVIQLSATCSYLVLRNTICLGALGFLDLWWLYPSITFLHHERVSLFSSARTRHQRSKNPTAPR